MNSNYIVVNNELLDCRENLIDITNVYNSMPICEFALPSFEGSYFKYTVVKNSKPDDILNISYNL